MFYLVLKKNTKKYTVIEKLFLSIKDINKFLDKFTLETTVQIINVLELPFIYYNFIFLQAFIFLFKTQFKYRHKVFI